MSTKCHHLNMGGFFIMSLERQTPRRKTQSLWRTINMQPYYTYPQQYNAYQGYQTPQYQAFPQQQANYAQNGSQGAMGGVDFVSGIEGAKCYIIPPNTTKFLLDNDWSHFYIKQTMANGNFSVRSFRCEEEQGGDRPQQKVDLNQYVHIDKFKELQDRFTKLQEEVENIKMIRPIINRGGETK